MIIVIIIIVIITTITTTSHQVWAVFAVGAAAGSGNVMPVTNCATGWHRRAITLQRGGRAYFMFGSSNGTAI
jgi:hypothetical protein